MRVYHDLQDLPAFQNAVLTIGSFDGVHRGHQHILDQVNALARKVKGESVVLTFHPHPRLVVYPNDKSLQLLTTIDEKVQLLEQYGVDNVVVVPFTVEFSQLSADQYIEEFLYGKFKPHTIIIGYDHRFGINRQGDINYLRWHGKRLDFAVEEIPPQEVDDIAVSSTKIRNALNQGSVDAAQKWLGHPFMLTGQVVKGEQIGTTLGFPTANVEVNSPHKLVPPDGIYAVYGWHKGQRYEGMLYIGTRPTLPELKNRTIEVNLFAFDKSIYGDKIKLEFVEYLRDDVQFNSLPELQDQLQKDQQSAEAVFRKLNQATRQAQETPLNKNRNSPKVAVVILNYNTQALLQEFLPFVLASTYKNIEVVVADNGSSDNSKEWLQEAYPAIRLINLKQNWGFAEGYNKALEQVEADYYVLLNSDVEVTPNWIEPILQRMEQEPGVAAAQPKILAQKQRNTFEYAGAAGGWIDYLGYPFCRGRIFQTVEEDRKQYDSVQEIFWASGAALFIKASLFRQIGGFDPSYFAHLEEVDLCWRLKRAGFRILAVPNSTVYHVGGATLEYENPQKTYLNFRNSLFTLVKNESSGKLRWLLPTRLVLDGVAGMLFLLQGRFRHVQAIVKAHWSFFPVYRQVLAKRRQDYEQIQRISIQPEPNRVGIYPKSIVWQYYARGVKRFKNLD